MSQTPTSLPDLCVTFFELNTGVDRGPAQIELDRAEQLRMIAQNDGMDYCTGLLVDFADQVAGRIEGAKGLQRPEVNDDVLASLDHYGARRLKKVLTPQG